MVALTSQLNGPRINPCPPPPRIRNYPHLVIKARKVATANITRSKLEQLIQTAIDEPKTMDTQAYNDQIDDLFVVLMHVLDIEDGRGERQLFIWMFLTLYPVCPIIAIALLSLIPEYGCWRTLRTLYLQSEQDTKLSTELRTRLSTAILELFTNQLYKDIIELLNYQTKQAEKLQKQTLLTTTNAATTSTNVTSSSSSSSADSMDIDNEDSLPIIVEGKNKNKKLRKILRKGPKLSLIGKWAPTLGGSVDKKSNLGYRIAESLQKRLSENEIHRIIKPGSTITSTDNTGTNTTTKLSTSSTMTVSTTNKRKKMKPTKEKLVRSTYTEKIYRKTLSLLRESLGVLERKMANNEWNMIEATAVPSLSNKKYNAVLLNKRGNILHFPRKDDDKSRGGLDLTKINIDWGTESQRSEDINRRLLSQNVRYTAEQSMAINNDTSKTKTKKSKTIKGSRNQVHELVEKTIQLIEKENEDKLKDTTTKTTSKPTGKRFDDDTGLPPLDTSSSSSSSLLPKIIRNGDILIEAMWSDLVRTMQDKGKFDRIIPIVDVSGSMDGTPLYAALALGILACSLNAKDTPWYGKLITFNSNPSWFDISEALPSSERGSLYDSIKKLMTMPWGGRTHFGKALRLLLDVMVTVKLPVELAPTTLLCLTDMQFQAADGSSEGYYSEPLHAQLCIIMDCTGSMGTWIEASKACVIEAAEQIKLCLPADSTYECAYICYRDHCDGDSRIVQYPFTSNIEQLRQNILNVRASGGGDLPEDVAGGFHAASQLPWKKKVGVKLIIHVADAPAHGKKYTDAHDNYPDGDPLNFDPYTQMKEFAQRGIDYTFFRIQDATDKMTDVLKEGFIEGSNLPGGYGKDACFTIEDLQPVLRRVNHKELHHKATKYLADVMVSSVVRSAASIGRRLQKHLASNITTTAPVKSTFIPELETKESESLGNQPFTFAGEDVLTAFDQAGYPRPTVVFWNLRSNTDELTYQADASIPGVAMVSGFSQETLRQFCEEGVTTTIENLQSSTSKSDNQSSSNVGNEEEKKKENTEKSALNAWERLYKVLHSERYNRIRLIVDEAKQEMTN